MQQSLGQAPGLRSAGRIHERTMNEAPGMANRRTELTLPAWNEATELRASRERGVWWERRDGLEVRLAAPERERPVERRRLSFLGMLLACAVGSGNAPRP